MGRAIIDPNNPPVNVGKLVLDQHFVETIRSFTCVYHDNEDTLFFRPQKPKPAVSIDWNGELWFRIDAVTSELVGIEIEDFESVFLKKYPVLSPAWKEFKPLCTRRYGAKNGNLLESFMRVLLGFLSELFESHPQQLIMHGTI